MKPELILGAIGTALGILNFVYWAWWARREKFSVYSSGIHAHLEAKNNSQKSAAVTYPTTYLRLHVGCDLVMVRGGNETTILGVDVQFDKKIYEKLGTYFKLPLVNQSQLLTHNEECAILLRPKVPVSFNSWLNSFETNSRFEEEVNKAGDTLIKSLLKQFEKSNYRLCLLRYDGKELYWKFPDKWWRNLDKKLWG
ncbi:MAG: hypothetical protein HY662_05030 [Chloroflexi bacterium]|nr:hypothetical protein [Chloroflexota bacterium]